jgi:membrane protein required for colicin V production
MNAADVVIGIILIVGVASGIAHGFVRGILGLVGLVLGIVLAVAYYDWLAENALSFLPGEHVPQVLSFLLIFLAVVLLIGALARVLSHVLKLSTLGWLDRLAGGLLGLITASILASAVLFLAVVGGAAQERVLVESTLAPKVVRVTDAVVLLLPADVRERIYRAYDGLRMEWRRAKLRAPGALLLVAEPALSSSVPDRGGPSSR